MKKARNVPTQNRGANLLVNRQAAPRAVHSENRTDARPSSPLNRWTFLTNHAHVLAVIQAQPEIVLRQVALRIGITERAVQRIVQDLEEAGYLVRERVGRRNRYQIVTDRPLRHPIEAHRKIGDLLQLVAQSKSSV